MAAWVDHLVIGAADLDQGAAWCVETLGAAPGPVGRHASLGTHNRCLPIGSLEFPQAYLEILAIDPDAPAPTRVRWFGLDGPAVAARLRAGPVLLALAARTDALAEHGARLLEAGVDPGSPWRLSRETPSGPLRWRILLRDDGQSGGGPALPALLEWESRHPAAAMPAPTAVLESLTLAGLAPALRAALDLRGPVAWSDASPPGVTAVLRTPRGRVALASWTAAE